VKVVMNLQVPYNVGNFLTSWELDSLSKRTLLCGVSEYVNKYTQHMLSCKFD
jgi:hypothetical protein